jgi:hypothetical protein
MDPFYNFQSYPNTYCTKLKGTYVLIEKLTLPPLIEELLLAIVVGALGVIMPWVVEA